MQRRVKLPRQRKVVSQQLGLGFDRERKVVLESVDDAAVKSLPLTPRQRGINGVPYQRVLESVRFVRKFAAYEDRGR